MRLYSTNCPKCNILEKKLTSKNVEFEKVTNFDPAFLIDKGFNSAPVLELDDGKLIDFSAANNYINSL